MLQLIKFGFIGAVATLVDVGIFAALKEFFGINVQIASAISFLHRSSSTI